MSLREGIPRKEAKDVRGAIRDAIRDVVREGMREGMRDSIGDDMIAFWFWLLPLGLCPPTVFYILLRSYPLPPLNAMAVDGCPHN